MSLVRSSAAEYLTFVAAGGGSEASVEMRYEDENIWLTQKMMATLYDVSVPAINQHLKRIFAAVQNKMHYAIHGQTAAEVIVDRADHRKENMGLTYWEGAPQGKIHRYDVVIAKNYLSDFELSQMQRIVSAISIWQSFRPCAKSS